MDLVSAGTILLIAGLGLVLLGLAYRLRQPTGKRSSETKARVRGGGVIIIGPIPIIFGSDAQIVRVLLILTIVLVTLLVMIFLVRFFV